MVDFFNLTELIRFVKKQNRVFLYGAGMVGGAFLQYCRRLDNSYDKRIPLDGFFVTNQTDDITWIEELPVYVFSEYCFQHSQQDVFVIITVRESIQGQIMSILNRAGWSNYALLTGEMIREIFREQTQEISTLYHRLDMLEESFLRMIPKPSINFSFHLTDACNLNCKGCWHFAPLANNEFPDICEFEKDIIRLAEVMEGEITLISLFGGEPLLNKETYKYPYIIKKYLPDTQIEILTNGILLPQQNEKFWQSLYENEVIMEWTRYPVSDEVNRKIEQVLKEKKSRYRIFNGGEKSLSHIVLDTDAIGNNGQCGRNDARWQWIHCFRAGDCVQLKDHKLYPCTTAANAHILKNYFDINIRLSELDGIDIYKADSREEILNFLAKPIPFCRYCNVQKETYGHKWSVSKRELCEWT